MAEKAATVRTRTLATGETAAGQGFTILELLVVLAILGIVVALGAPALHRMVPGVELNTSAQTVATALREARGLAIASNAEVTLVVELGDRALRVGDGPPVRLASSFGITLLTATRELIDAGTGQIRFYPDGTSTGGRITLTHGNRRYHVVVDWLTGRVALGE
ncbi:MAG TPA: GspH/FimT family pseudopilin [Pseudolabrys sp.]|nr:GspH/FimT family pseudopilin [Pseudolabrys sp.]